MTPFLPFQPISPFLFPSSPSSHFFLSFPSLNPPSILMKPTLKIFLIILVFAVLLLAGIFYFQSKLFKNSSPIVEVNNHKFSVEIADEPRERSHGLGGREKLCADCGMIFLFDKPGQYAFWMKDMKFALDFIWIAGDKIIDIDEKISPSYPGTLKPGYPIDKVLEVSAGACGKNKIRIGDEIKLYLR